MIKFTLTCPDAHDFESWFQSGEAYARLREGGHVSCPTCGSTEIAKTVMAPSVQTSLKAPQAPLKALRDKIEASADYVGADFARQAREMHEGTTPDRPIYGEANARDAKALLADGVPVLPLPFIPTKKAN